MANKNANKKCVYKINENCKPRRNKRIPMFESFLESKYCVDFSLVDNKKYKLTADIVSQDGTVLAKAGDTVIYKDGMGTFGNAVESFVSDCGSFVTGDDQNLQPEVLLSNGVVTDPINDLKKEPIAPIVQAIAECRAITKRVSRKVYEDLTPEQKKKYEDAHSKMSDEEINKLNTEVDQLEQDAVAAGEAQDWKKMRSIYKKSLEKYRKATGGEDPEWYQGEDPYADMVSESISPEQKAKYEAKKAKLSDEDIQKITAEIDNIEQEAMDLQEAGKENEIPALYKRALEKYRTITGGEDPEWYDESLDESDEFSMEDISEDDANASIAEDIVEKDELKEMLTAAGIEDATADTITAALPADKEDVSMIDVVKAVIAEDVPIADANKVIDALAGTAVAVGTEAKESEEGTAVNEAAKAKIKGKIMESLKKHYRKSVFEKRYKGKK